MSEAANQSTNESREEEEQLTDRIRGFVGGLLKSGVQASDISYALTYVATELGLVVANDPVRVFPVVLGAVARATAARSAEGDEPEPAQPPKSRLPGNTTIH